MEFDQPLVFDLVSFLMNLGKVDFSLDGVLSHLLQGANFHFSRMVFYGPVSSFDGS
jgi:hypothetical protein